MRDGSDTIKCYRCGEVKPAEEYAWRRKYRGQRDSFCRPCRSAYGKEHYAANRERYIEQAKKLRRRVALEKMKRLLEFLEAHPCVDCGERDPVVLEFDHLRDKSFAIGTGLHWRSWESLVAEMAKCEVVCANCHRRRTTRRKGGFRIMLTEGTTED